MGERGFLMRKLFKIIALLALAAVIAHNAYAQGVRHAAATAHVWAEGDAFLIDFDGEVHEYR